MRPLYARGDRDTGSENRQTSSRRSCIYLLMMLNALDGTHRTQFLETGSEVLTRVTWLPRGCRRYGADRRRNREILPVSELIEPIDRVRKKGERNRNSVGP